MATAARLQLDTGYFFQQIAQAQHSTLVIDFDTTLRSFVVLPHSKFRVPTITELLDCILVCGRTRVILISGHDAREVAGHLTPPFPEVWGRNGAERISPVAAATAKVSFCIRPRPRTTTKTIANLLDELSVGGPLAYLIGETCAETQTTRLPVRPQFYLNQTDVVWGPTEDLTRFLADWLWACAGETC
jgi:hypothetical protein